MSKKTIHDVFDEYEDELNQFLSSIKNELADDANEELVKFSVTMFIRNIIDEILSAHKDEVIRKYEKAERERREELMEQRRKHRDMDV